MLLLIIAIVVVSLGIILQVQDSYDYDISSLACLLFGGLSLVVMILVLLLKPVEYTDFKIKYETTKNMITNKDDIRDAAFTNNLLEINEDILTCRAYINSNWVGIFQNKNICDTELLSKEDLYEKNNNHIN